MQRLPFKSGLVILTCIIPHTLTAEEFLQSQKEFDAYQSRSEQQFKARKDEFERYHRRLQAAFDQYRRESARIWGKKHTVMPGKTRWVSYQGDLRHRSVVDFESGRIRVELALERDPGRSEQQARQQLEDSILRSLNQGSDTRSMLDIARQPVAVSTGPAVLDGQVATLDGRPAGSHDYSELARQAAAGARSTDIQGEDGKRRRIYRADLSLVPNHIRQRAERYQSDVNREAREHNIPAAVVFAIMETESMFNPTARSPAPAFGLMQLVPTSGAREAYRYLHNRDRIVSDTYLYNPANNIRLGTAFLNRLYYKYLAGIENPQARLWATIAAYNTGASNVLRSFAGKYSRSKYGSRETWKRAAFNEINRQSAEQVFQHMAKNLPYTETRNYIHKVRSRMDKYSVPRGA